MAIQTLGLTVPEKRSNNPTAPLSVGWHNLFDHGYSDAGGVDVNPHTVIGRRLCQAHLKFNCQPTAALVRKEWEQQDAVVR